MKVEPFPSKMTLDVHHDQSTCTLGDNIESYNVVKGTGGLPKCSQCKSIGG